MKTSPKLSKKFPKGKVASFKTGDISTDYASGSDHSIDFGYGSSMSLENVVENVNSTTEVCPIFNLENLRSDFLTVWKTIDSMNEATPFRVPVDPISMGIPDYVDIIKEPMDLAKIRQKLDSMEYKTPREFCNDFWLMFNNSWTYNKKTLKVYKFTTKLSKIFVENMDPIMKNYGYCCSDQHQYSPLVLICHSKKSCVIKRNEEYYFYERKTGQKNEDFYYCYSCFEKLPHKRINLANENEEEKKIANKSDFILLTNNKIDVEQLEKCKICGKDWHNACAEFNEKIFNQKFICLNCRVKKKIPKMVNIFKAEKLPRCHLATQLEMRVKNFLALKHLSNVTVIIRMVNNKEKQSELKPLMKEHYKKLKREGKIPLKKFSDKFPYRAKGIFAFQKIDDKELCFFGMFVQEYDNSAAAPNWRRVYISYLDSVHYFEPKEIRSMIYQEIILGYLEYMRNEGYLFAHIWSCPPNEGDDYIFNCHPPEQKIPDQERLQEWYLKLIEKGKHESIIFGFNNILEQVKEDNIKCLTDLPYFDGDLWPNIIEDILKQCDSENEENIPEFIHEKGRKSIEPPKKKRKSSMMKLSIIDLLFRKIEKHQNEFLIIRLNINPILRNIIDKNPLIENDVFEGRESFLSKSKDEKMEFSSLRRTKYSTMLLCYYAHIPECHCNICNDNAVWHCNTCEDYDLCQKCHQRGHEHVMTEIHVTSFCKFPYHYL